VPYASGSIRHAAESLVAGEVRSYAKFSLVPSTPGYRSQVKK
jgi:hypothetical protein